MAACDAADADRQLELPTVVERRPRRLVRAATGAVHAGEFDGFCTIIDAVRLALYPVRPMQYAENKALFSRGIRYLERQDMLASAGFGMPLPSWHPLAIIVVVAASTMMAVPITIERPFDHHDIAWPAMLDRIRRFVDEYGAVMLVLHGAYRHGGRIIWSETVSPPKTAARFARDAIYVICNSGMRNSVA